MVQMKTIGAVRGMTVKGAPYSAEEVNETNQVLADGTRIHRENRTTVYRDSEGRTRRETPDNITITDPVANVTYFLDPKTMTGQKLTMAEGNFAFIRSDFAEGIPVKGEGPRHFPSPPGATVRPPLRSTERRSMKRPSQRQWPRPKPVAPRRPLHTRDARLRRPRVAAGAQELATRTAPHRRAAW